MITVREQSTGPSDIKQIGNDYNRNRKGSVKQFSVGGQMPISPEIKSKLKALADDSDVPSSSRRSVKDISVDRKGLSYLAIRPFGYTKKKTRWWRFWSRQEWLQLVRPALATVTFAKSSL